MFDSKKIFKSLILFLTVIVCSLFIVPAYATAESSGLYLGGFPAGFVLNTTRVEVVGICDIISDKGMCSPAREAGIKSGDVISKINGEDVKKTSDINRIISKEYKKFEITVLRGADELKLEINPAKDMANGEKKLGILVKDSINGIGTVTFIDRTKNQFASLGHPVTDPEGKIIEIYDGKVYGSLIYDIKKGVRGTPGELRGAFEGGTVVGCAKSNCASGVYGNVDADFDYSKLTKIETSSVSNVNIGTAYIYSTVYGNTAEKYKISIVKVDKDNKDNRNFVIKIEDKNLIEKTGGIVQGMSGSPIVQNGKLIGAVTHVFVIIWIPAIAERHF